MVDYISEFYSFLVEMKDFFRIGSIIQIIMYLSIAIALFYIGTGMNFIVTIFFIIIMIGAILLSCVFSQSNKFHPIGRSQAIIVFCVSIPCSIYGLILIVESLINSLLVSLLGWIGITISFINLIVMIQRESKLESIGFDDNFIKKEEERWSKAIKNQQIREKTIEYISGVKFIVDLFNMGMFSLVVLWSCNTMEKIIDIYNTDRISYPKKMKNLGLTISGADNLWHKVRNKIAHHNEIPTFDETCNAIKLLMLFLSSFTFNNIG